MNAELNNVLQAYHLMPLDATVISVTTNQALHSSVNNLKIGPSPNLQAKFQLIHFFQVLERGQEILNSPPYNRSNMVDCNNKLSLANVSSI